jgi:hypothetical protein
MVRPMTRTTADAIQRWQALCQNLERLRRERHIRSRRAASLAAGLKPSVLRDIYRRPGLQPMHSTLEALARLYGLRDASQLYADGGNGAVALGSGGRGGGANENHPAGEPSAQPQDETVEIPVAVLDSRTGRLVISPVQPILLTKSRLAGKMAVRFEGLRALSPHNTHGYADPDDLAIVDTTNLDPTVAGVFVVREAQDGATLDLYRLQRVPGTSGARLRLLTKDGGQQTEVEAGSIIILGRVVKIVAVRDPD